MKLGICTDLFGDRPLEAALDFIRPLGYESVELGVGGYHSRVHGDPEALLSDEALFARFMTLLEKKGVTVSALAVHGNPLHPDPAVSAAHDRDFRLAVLLAEKMKLDTVVTFSGCPGAGEDDRHPNWISCAWPDDRRIALDWQWEKKLIPYWTEAAAYAAAHGVTQIALELHPGCSVYNAPTLLRLREAVGEAADGCAIAAAPDPAVLELLGEDPVAVIRALGGAIAAVRVSDLVCRDDRAAVTGWADTTPLDAVSRSRSFACPGYGHGDGRWRSFLLALREAGYDGAVSVAREDRRMGAEETVSKAAAFLMPLLIRSPQK